MSKNQSNNDTREALKRNFKINIILLVLFCVTMLTGTIILRQQLMTNAMENNSLLLNKYCNDEENQVETFKAMLTLAANFIDEKEQQNATVDEIRSGLYPYLEGFNELYSPESLRAIAIINGHIISNEEYYDNFDDGVYDYSATSWYKNTIAAEGEIYVSEAYDDYTTGKISITMAKKMEYSDSIILFDIFFDGYHTDNRALDLPEDGAYYLADENGRVMYSETNVFDNDSDMQDFVSDVIEKGSGKEWSIESYIDAKGNTRSAYAERMDNGWTVIFTIPHKNATGRTYILYFAIGISFVMGAAVIVYLATQEYRQAQKTHVLLKKKEFLEHNAQVVQKTIKSTMQSYREIYYVDFDRYTYQMIYPKSGSRVKFKKNGDAFFSSFIERIVDDSDKERAYEFFSGENIRNELVTKEYMEMRFKHPEPDGSFENCTATVTAVDYRDSTPVSITVAIRSIENVLKQEAAQREILSLAAQRAEAANHAKSDFLSNMSHDIRTPMNAILGMTAIALMHIDDKERVKDSLNKIAFSGRHLLGLINSVLDMSKIESGKITLNEEEFELSDTVEGLITLFDDRVREKGQLFKVNVTAIEHENVIGDSQRLQQIFVNIMGNAVKFTPEGGTISLTIREKPSNIIDRGCYEFVFKDNGIGMDEEFVKKVFEPFSRAEDSRITVIEGTGLGMSIAMNVARLMGGDIRVKSELGVGSEFTVTVYLKINEDDTGYCDRFSGLHVLVADDDEITCENTCEMLSGLEMRAEYVTGGSAAVARVEQAQKENDPFSIVIVDWKMPGTDGMETSREIKSLTGGETPIIILSAFDWSEVEQEAVSLGISGFIEKPLFKSRLVHVLKQAIGLNENAAESLKEITAGKEYKDMRVLLVEDNELNIEVAGELFNAIGIQTEVAGNGKQAVDKLSSTSPGYFDMVFMDIQMPIMNGYQAAKTIRSMKRKDLKNIPIIAMTADAFADDVRKSEEAGMNGHISKPVDIAKIKEMVDRWTVG